MRSAVNLKIDALTEGKVLSPYKIEISQLTAFTVLWLKLGSLTNFGLLFPVVWSLFLGLTKLYHRSRNSIHDDKE